MARRHGRTTCLLLLAGLVALALAAPAGASTPNKPYLVRMSPGLTAGGQNVTITATFTNMTGQQQIGSANLFWPTAVFPGGPTTDPATQAPPVQLSQPGTWTLSNSCTFGTSTGPCIQLRNLSLLPGNTLVVTITAATPACSATAGAWKVEAKQSNNFSGPPGNDLTLSSSSQVTSTLDGACSLAWNSRAQPTDSLTNNPISSVPFTPGSPISVNVLDSSYNVLSADGSTGAAPAPTVTLTAPSNPGVALAGASAPAAGGIASFPNLTIGSRGDFYTLTASSGTLSSSGPSNAFDIVDKYTFAPCSMNKSCSTNDSNSLGSGQVVANPTSSGTLTLSINSNSGNTLPCSYVSADQNVYGFDGPGSKVGTITITNPNLSSPTLTGTAKQVLSAQQICFDGPVDFTTASGALAPHDPTGSGFVGLLPTCATDPDNQDDPDGDADDTTGPCHNRQQDTTTRDPSSPLGYDIHLVADIPAEPGDPHMS